MWLRSFLGYFLALFCLGIVLFFSADLQKLLGKFDKDDSKVFRLLDSLMRAPKVYLSDQNDDEVTKSQNSCLYHTCFDVYKCGGSHRKILVHIPEPLRVFAGNKSWKTS